MFGWSSLYAHLINNWIAFLLWVPHVDALAPSGSKKCDSRRKYIHAYAVIYDWPNGPKEKQPNKDVVLLIYMQISISLKSSFHILILKNKVKN